MKYTPQERLSEYLRQIIFEEETQAIDMDELPEELRELGDRLRILDRWLKETKCLSEALSRGDLDAAQPGNDNVLAAPLKALQAAMKQLTWQAGQVTGGDYTRKSEHMGELSAMFNDMVTQLAEKENALEHSRNDAVKAKQILRSVMDGMDSYFVILKEKEHELQYGNDSFQKLQTENPQIAEQLKSQIWLAMSGLKASKKRLEIEIHADRQAGEKGSTYFLVDANFLTWRNEPAIACIIEDISEERRNEQKIKEFAFFDALTGLHNRRYIMDVLDKWLEEKTSFAIIFVDLDNLKFANDEAGHEEGDKYIKQVANMLFHVEGEIEVARIGGDEFLLLVKDRSEEDIQHELEQKRATLFKMGKTENAIYLKSFSYGIVDADAFDSRYRSELLREADKRMYAYKMKNKPKIKRP